VRQIFPAHPDAPEIGEADQADRSAVTALAGLYAYPDTATAAAPWVRANMIASADGAGSLDGRSGGLSGAADRLLFSVLRSLAEVILVGAGTARAEKYRPVKEGEVWTELRGDRAPPPPIAVVTSGHGLDPDGPLLAGAPGTSRTIVLTTAAAPAAWRAAVGRHADVAVAGQDAVTAAAAISALAERGYQRILTEGGPTLLRQITVGGLLDDLCLTFSPVLEGGRAGRIMRPQRDAGPEADVPARLRLAHGLEDHGYLLCRYLRNAGTDMER
jgi:riboflavin biosynthesis pyrimidine reductase